MSKHGEPVVEVVAGKEITITHPKKPYFPQANITKLEVINFYREIKEPLLNYIKDRPITIRAYPEGIEKVNFWLRDAKNANRPDWIRTIPYKTLTTGEVIELIIINDEPTLVWWANRGGIEFHPWQSKYSDLEHPDLVVFDIDISSPKNFKLALKTALLIKQELDQYKLKSFVKTSGGNGLHVILPISPVATYEQIRLWVKNIGEKIAFENPEIVSTPTKGRTHQSLATIDYAQNSIGKNTVAAYSLRANPLATVSTPLTWDEVQQGTINPQDFNFFSIQKRINRYGDLLKSMSKIKQQLPISKI